MSSSQLPPEPTKKAGSSTTKAALIAAAVVGVMSLTVASEGTLYKAYKDPVGIWTICNGHTKGVKAGDVASKEQCRAYYREDMTTHMTEALQAVPTLAEHPNALKASGDFTFNSGAPAFSASPMAKHFRVRNWTAGCNAFSGYYVGGTFAKRQPKMVCRPHSKKPGKFLCNLPGLVTRREKEKQLCLTGAWSA